MSWHIDEPTLAALRRRAGPARRPRRRPRRTSRRARTAGRGSRRPWTPAASTAIWDEVDDRVDVASLPWFERALVRLGVGEDTARLLAATPSLTTSWLGSLAAAVALRRGGRRRVGRRPARLPHARPDAAGGGRRRGVRTDGRPGARARGRRAVLAAAAAAAAQRRRGRQHRRRSSGWARWPCSGHGWTAVAWLLPALALSTTTLALSARVDAGLGGGRRARHLGRAGVSSSGSRRYDDLAAFGARRPARRAGGRRRRGRRWSSSERPTFAFDSRRSA